MSGRLRNVPLSQVFSTTCVALVVDMETMERQDRSVVIKMPRGSQQRSFEFAFQEMSITAVEIIYCEPDLRVVIGEPISVVSESVQRSKHYQTRVARDGARKIMYYDRNSEFECEIESTRGLLLIKGYDAQLEAFRASMGTGLLRTEHREAVELALLGEEPPIA